MSNLPKPKEDPEGAEAVYNAVLNAKDQGVRVLGEYVETKEQYELLKEIGVGAAEGYYFSRPRAFAETVSLKGNWEEEIEYLVTRPYYRELEKLNLVDLRHNDANLSRAFPTPASCIMERYDEENHILVKGPTLDAWYEDVSHWPEFSWDQTLGSDKWYSITFTKEDKDVLMKVHFLVKDIRTGRLAFLVVFVES